jgi:hypothetical protein
MRSTWLAALTLASVAIAGPIYKWVDKEGEEHFTNDPSAIPAGEKATVTEGDELGELSVRKEPAKREEPRARPAGRERPPDERDWRERFRRVHDQIRELEIRVEADQGKVDATRDQTLSIDTTVAARGARPLTRRDSPEARSRAQLDKDQAALQSAKEDLADLEREASRALVPQDWRH